MIKLLKINKKAKIKYVLLMVAIFCNLAFLFYQIYYSKNNAEGLVLNVTGYPYSLVTDSDNMYFLEMDYSESDKVVSEADAHPAIKRAWRS